MSAVANTLVLLMISPLLIFAVHVGLCRLWPQGQRQILAVLSILAALAPMAALYWAAALHPFPMPAAERFAGVLYFGIGYGAVAFAYFNVFNMSETARRIRLLREIYQAGTLRIERVAERYGTTGIISIRLERLVDTHQLELRDGRYILNARFFLLAALLFEFWRALIGFESWDRFAGWMRDCRWPSPARRKGAHV